MISITSNGSSESPEAFLNATYDRLNYVDGSLLDAANLPKIESSSAEAWVEKGDWLSLAQRAGAEKIFFVNNDPVIVFCKTQSDDAAILLNLFRRIWCMARPHFLFIAFPGELRVYSLNRYPVRTVSEWEQFSPLDVVKSIADVSERLHHYRRELVESGQVFKDKNPGRLEYRADKRLILDLKAARKNLVEVNPTIRQRHIHAVIGRSIFVRYLEDRGVLTPDYFRRVAEDRSHPKWHPDWLNLLETPDAPLLISNNESMRYTRVLRNKDFTYALFNQLADHFNGDMFPRDPEEENAITQEHLNLLRGFLLGDTDQRQRKLFLWAYDFDIIPIELISSIYEEFYHKASATDSGTHYTPSVLVEYVLSQLLTPERLVTNPRILDFACGSAIFLVQAFRRIVRYKESLFHRSLSAPELRQILREQITGIEINEEAVHVAAFSLYLALLHYQEPKDILAQIAYTNSEKPLPYLIYDPEYPPDATHYHVLYQANAFSLLDAERVFLADHLESNKRFAGRSELVKLLDSPDSLPFLPHSFDIIVGNPPWGYLKENEGTPELRAAQEHAQRWCDAFGWPIGDKELSQAFIARAPTFLKPDGEVGLLVSTGVILKRHKNSLKFRQRWLSESVVEKVVNFTHVRTAFFSGAISPFCFIQYQPGEADSSHFVQYWSAKKLESIDNVQAVILSLPDLHRVRQFALENDDWLWKTYWWGNQHDAALLQALKFEQELGQLAQHRNWITGQGYTPGSVKESGWLKEYRELPVEELTRYVLVTNNDIRPIPQRVHRRGIRDLYDGWRLLVKRGITQTDEANGRIEARFENRRYCFRNSVHGIKLDYAEDWERKILTGILWSSLARYFFFMTTSSWGTWHHEIHLQDGLLNLPICFPESTELRQRIVGIVDELRHWNPTSGSMLNPSGFTAEKSKRVQESLERELDEAIFELYDLSESERDLILDMCETGLEFFYRGGSSKAVEPVELHPNVQGTMANLHGGRNNERGLEGYLYAFLQVWNRELESLGGEFRWRIIRPPFVPMLAVVFTTQEVNTPLPAIETTGEAEWPHLLARLSETLRQPVSSQIYIDGMVRVVTDTNIFIIKRNERRLWTRSLAREDAEAALLQAIHLQESAL
ncbi:MAG: SAM-dependent DNA methyltransferase [Anaerolineae bacterium]|nr:SAM-dependent DNA methyltransferase [Anaerolineae bacterium]